MKPCPARIPGLFPLLALRLLAAAFLILAGTGGRARAEGLSGYMEWTYNRAKTATEDNTVAGRTDTESTSFLQRYFLGLDRRIFPNLTFYTSGFFERNGISTETDGSDTDATMRRIRPIVELRLRTPLYIAEVSYNRAEQKTEVTGSSPRTDVNELYSTTLQWKPDGFPQLKLWYSRTDNYDKARLFRDTTDDQFQVTTEYRPVDTLLLWYQGTLQKTDDRLQHFEVQQESHAARVTYSDSWWKGLVTVYSDYNVDRRMIEVTAGGGGEITLAVPALEGLSAIDDTPEDGALAPNPTLIDGNFTAGTGINLGLPPPGGDTRPRNAGLRFDAGTEVNTFFVWVDRELPADIASSFSWQVYASDDNLNWNPVGTASAGTFDTFQHRFEVRFPNVTDRYVKVVVDPLSPTVPGATGFPTILVTELQAAIRRTAEEAVGKQTRTVHRYNLDVRTRILEVPSLFYEFSYILTKPDPGESNWTLSNGLSASHRFTPKLSGAARVAREDGREGGEDRVAYIYTASLTAIPLETLRHTLVFSGLNETVGESGQDTYSLLLQNNAQLYQGVDVTLGGGVSLQSLDPGEDAFTTQINGLVTLVPNRKMTVNLIYNDRVTERSGGTLTGTVTDSTRNGEVNLTLTPLSTVYLFGSWGILKQSGQETRRTQRYSATFSPFPDGTLHLNFFYDDEFESLFHRRTRVVTPSLRWNITRNAYLDLSYSKISDDSDISKTDNQIVNGTARIFF